MDQDKLSDQEDSSDKPAPVKKGKVTKKPAKEPSQSSDNNIAAGMMARKEEVFDEDMEEDEILRNEIGGNIESQGQESSHIKSNGINTTIETIQKASVKKTPVAKSTGKMTGSKRNHRQMNSK